MISLTLQHNQRKLKLIHSPNIAAPSKDSLVSRYQANSPKKVIGSNSLGGVNLRKIARVAPTTLVRGWSIAQNKYPKKIFSDEEITEILYNEHIL